MVDNPEIALERTKRLFLFVGDDATDLTRLESRRGSLCGLAWIIFARPATVTLRCSEAAKEDVCAGKMSAELKPDLELEIAYLLLIDVVGYSKLLVNEQIELLDKLNGLVRSTASFQAAENNNKLIRVPTGDGMALIFFRSPEEPARCAIEISEALRTHPDIQLRMGVHSGPINQVTDVNDRINVAGTGINIAQRLMDCADAGYILL